jgi:hypothetical protein
MEKLLSQYEQKVIEAKNRVIVCPTASNNKAFMFAVKNYQSIKKYLEGEKGVQ